MVAHHSTHSKSRSAVFSLGLSDLLRSPGIKHKHKRKKSQDLDGASHNCSFASRRL